MTYGGFKRMTGFCKTRVPQELSDALEKIKDDDEAVKAFGVSQASYFNLFQRFFGLWSEWVFKV